MSTTSTTTKIPELAIRMRNLTSTSSLRSIQTTETLPAYTTSASTSSILPPYQALTPQSSTSSLALSQYTTATEKTTFHTSKTLHVVSQGKDRISLPSPSKELEISILDEEKQNVKYLSIKPQRKSGNCTLFENVEELGLVPRVETMYRAGPGRAPVVKVLNEGEVEECDELVLDSPSLVSRSVRFESRGSVFEWRYAGKKEREILATECISFAGNSSGGSEVPNNLLILEKILPLATGKKGREERIVIARFIRGESTRTAGTKASTAGNGGRLDMCLRGPEKEHFGIDEATVLSTVLVMLKKEIDRLRLIQIMVVSSAMSGGGGP